ncbi:MAG: hypothetical protein JW808_03650 [Victivallales bacterium]|nr:hypothetical protein [Victivallales bacterium]
MRAGFFKIAGAAGLVFLALFFRLAERQVSSLWTDEFATYWISNTSSVSECLARSAPTQGQSPFFYVLQSFVLRFLPHDEHSLRVIALISSVVCVLLVYKLCTTVIEWGACRVDSVESQAGSQLISLPAALAAILCAIDISQVYYAQEARPYSLALAFSIASQIYFVKILAAPSIWRFTAYVLLSSLLCYTNYIFGSLLLFQNLWVFCLLLRHIYVLDSDRAGSVSPMKPRISSWIISQVAIGILMIPGMLHLHPVMTQSSQWNWLRPGGIYDTIKMFSTLFDWRIVSMFAAVFTMMAVWERLRGHKGVQKAGTTKPFRLMSDKTLVFLLTWFAAPPACAYIATQTLGSSFMDARYMLLSLIPFYLIPAVLISKIKSIHLAAFLASFIVFAYIGGVSVQAFKHEGRFSYRIPHNWRGAIEVLNESLSEGDIIVMRSGFVKENWVPQTDSQIVKQYVKAPLKSFYFMPRFINNTPAAPHSWDDIDEEDLLYGRVPVFNMTYTREMEFYDYYDSIIARCKEAERVWMIGVNPPNTNYLFSQVPTLLRDSHEILFEKDFSGVYLAMLRKKPEVYRIFKKIN